MSPLESDVAETDSWPRRAFAAFVLAALAGAGILPIRQLLRGSMDPFGDSPPLFLQASSLLVAAIIAFGTRCGLSSVAGVYAGLLLLMVFSGKAEYPVSSAIAFAVHGLIPAAIGAAAAIFLHQVIRPKSNSAADSEAPDGSEDSQDSKDESDDS